MNIKTTEPQEASRLFELLQLANHQIYSLADTTAKIHDDEEDGPVIHGLMARVKALTEVIFYTQQILQGNNAGGFNLEKLEAVYSGHISV